MVGPKILLEFLPGDSRSIVGMPILKWLPPILGSSLQLTGSIKHLFMVITLSYVQLSLHSSKLVISFQWFACMRECRWMSFINSLCLPIGGAWCGLFNTFWAIVCNNWVCIIKACSIDGKLDGGGLELAGFLLAPCEALLLVATICFQHVWIRTQSFITSLIVASRDDKIGLMAIETREHQTPEITNTSKRSARM